MIRIAAMTFAISLAIPVTAVATMADHVRITQAWIRLLPGNLPAGGYAELANDAAEPLVLRDIQSALYASAMLHQSNSDGGMSRMKMIDQLPLPAHARVTLSPGGYHIMLESPTAPVKVGDDIPLRFEFTDGSVATAHFTVRPANAVGPQD